MMKRPRSLLIHVLAWSFVCLCCGSSQAVDWSGLHVSYLSNWGAFLLFVEGELKHDCPSEDIGALVVAVAKGSAAEEANLARGDWLVRAFQGKIIQKDGDTESLLIEREGTRYSVAISTREHPLDQQLFVRLLEAEGGPRRLVVDRLGGGDYRTICRALSLALPGDTVSVRSGLYREELLVPHGVTLEAEGDGTVCVEAPNAIGILGVDDVVVRRLSLRGATSKGFPFSVLSGNRIRLENLTISSEVDGHLVVLNRTNDLVLDNCTLHGMLQGSGVSLSASQAELRDNVILQCKTAVEVADKSRLKSRGNLLDGNLVGIRAFNSTLSVEKDTIIGIGSDQGIGVVAAKGDIFLRGNVVRRHFSGLETTNAQGTVQDNVFGQCNTGILLQSSALEVRDNTISHNKGIGVFLDAAQDAADRSVRATITNNTIQFNAGYGISVREHATSISQNLIEGNYTGIRLITGPAEIFRNTIVLQQYAGFSAGATASGRVSNNIVAFNYLGMRIDRRSGCRRDSNVVYGNLGNKKLPLIDLNYVREDRLPLSDGDLLSVLIYPAADLKAEGDLQVDPRFVKLGSDYRLGPNSPLLTHKGKDGKTIGALSADEPMLEFRDELPQRLHDFFNRFPVKPWTEPEKRRIADAFVNVRETAPGLYARATAYGPIIVWRERTPSKANALATARWTYNAISFPDAAFVDLPSQPLEGTLIHELTHLVDGDHRHERSEEFRELFEPRIERVTAAVEKAGGDYFHHENSAIETADATRRFGHFVRAEGMPSLYGCTKPPEALAECVRATVDGEEVPQPIREYVASQFLKTPFEPDENRRLLHHSLKLLLENKTKDAEQVLSDLIAKNPAYAAAYSCRANLRRSSGNKIGAVEDYSRVIDLSQDSPYHLAHAYSERHVGFKQQQKWKEALADINEAIRLLPFEREFYTFRAYVRSLMMTGKPTPEEVDEELSDHNRAIEIAPHEAKLYFDRANAFNYRKKDYQRAEIDYGKAIELNPNEIDYFSSRGSMRLAAGRFSDALADFDRCAAAKPNDSFTLFTRGKCREAMKDFAGAIDDYSAAIKYWPLRFPAPEMNLRRGVCEVQIGRYEEGLADLKKVGKNDEAAAWIRKAEEALTKK